MGSPGILACTLHSGNRRRGCWDTRLIHRGIYISVKILNRLALVPRNEKEN